MKNKHSLVRLKYYCGLNCQTNLKGQSYTALSKKMNYGRTVKFFGCQMKQGMDAFTVYQVFSGIELYYNDMHMGYCNQNQATVKNMIEINHCLIGRFECSFGENSCCYMAEGDLSISSMMKKKSNSCFPLNHYHGISIVINLDELLPEIRQIMELLNIDLHYIQKYICEGNRCCIMRANPSIEHIFSELYHVREKENQDT